MSGPADRAEWVSLDGRIVAFADYLPLPRPVVGNASFLYPPQGWVAAGALYFVDGHGLVRRLDPSGAVTEVATFPITVTQQLISFVVSPDGKRLGAIIVTLPPLKPVAPDPFDVFQTGAPAYLDLEWADAGGATATTLHKDLTADPAVFFLPTLLGGWDQGGPVATLATEIGTQSAPASYPMRGSALVHIAADGTHLDRIGGPNCRPADELFDGTIVCTGHAGWPTSTVRSASGAPLWSVGGTEATICMQAQLSPDADRLACSQGVAFKTGERVSYRGLPVQAGGQPEVASPGGWLDNNWAVVVDDNGQGGLGLIDAASGDYRSVINAGPTIFVGSLHRAG